jgi:ketosteroid isomerase-like protein
VAERDDFLSAVLPRLTDADTALHDGDPGPRKAMWSQNDPVTLFGAAVTTSGSTEIIAVFDWLGSRFSNCMSFEYEVVAADASGDLAYIVGIERTTASIGGAAPQPYSLRVTTIFRRENGQWKVIHRHADPEPDTAETADQIERLRPAKSHD